MAATRQTGGKSKTKTTMTDAAIKARTGKDWAAWFTALDKAGAAQLDHKAIARLAARGYGSRRRWYGQMVAVSYERARGIRAMNQKCDGEFSVSVTRVMDVPLAETLCRCHDRPHRPGFLKAPSTETSRTTGQILARQMEDRPAGNRLLRQRPRQGADCASIQQAAPMQTAVEK